MLIDQIVVGARVRCVFQGYQRLYGQIGTIEQVMHRRNSINYWIKWDNGYADHGWGLPSSFELFDPTEAERLADQKRREEWAMQYL